MLSSRTMPTVAVPLVAAEALETMTPFAATAFAVPVDGGTVLLAPARARLTIQRSSQAVGAQKNMDSGGRPEEVSTNLRGRFSQYLKKAPSKAFTSFYEHFPTYKSTMTLLEIVV